MYQTKVYFILFVFVTYVLLLVHLHFCLVHLYFFCLVHLHVFVGTFILVVGTSPLVFWYSTVLVVYYVMMVSGT